MVKRFKWWYALVFSAFMVGCGNNPAPQYTPDGFNPPYNYY
jgi:hypothetical protein